MTELDFQKRKDYYREIQEMLIELAPTSTAMYAPRVTAHRNHVFGVRAFPGPHTFYQDWWIEK